MAKLKKESIKEVVSEEGLDPENSGATAEQTVEVIEEQTFSEVDQLKNQCSEINDKFVRLQAEFQNFKKRTEKERSNLYKFANEKLLVDLLPLMDNMERALSSTEVGSQGIVEGLKMIKKSLDDIFEKNDVKAIEALGNNFDPDLHHAVMSEGDNSEIVSEEFQKGYTLNEKVIRFSMVKVSEEGGN